jgi:FkbM family methyltransferase
MILDRFSEVYGRDRTTTAKIACNRIAYGCLRAIARQPMGGWLSSPWHWYRFPFSLRGSVLWSKPLRAWFRPENEAALEFMLHEADYEPVDWVAPSEGQVVLDIGAFVGWHTIRAAQIVGHSGRVISLEPDPANRRQLEINIKLNRLANCTVIPLAAWSNTNSRFGWYTGKSPDCCRIDAKESSTGVNTTTIDDLVSEMHLSRLDWIKMDIEGAETEALKGAKQTLSEYRPHLFVEIHNTAQPVRELLEHYGYSIAREAYDRSPEPHGWCQAHPGHRGRPSPEASAVVSNT